MRLASKFGITLALAGLFGSASAQFGTYYVHSQTGSYSSGLGGLGSDTESSARGINDLGDVVGWAKDLNGKQHAVIRLFDSHPNVFVSLHDGSVPWNAATAHGINNNRVVVGGYTEPGTGYQRPFYYYPGIWLESMSSDASVGQPYDWQATAYAINSTDSIVGEASLIVDPFLPPVPDLVGLCHMDLPVYWWGAGQYPSAVFCIDDPNYDNTWLGQGLRPRSRDINDAGHIVGTDGGTTTYSMFLRKNFTTIPVPRPSGMATMEDNKKIFGHAMALNEQDNVVGSFGYFASGVTASVTHAFYWDGVSALSQDLGTFAHGTYSIARDINEQKMVVGTAERKWLLGGFGGGGVAYTRNLAFIWHPHFGMVQLNSMENTYSPLYGWIPSDCEAFSINNRRTIDGRVQVVGQCKVNGKLKATTWSVYVKVNHGLPL